MACCQDREPWWAGLLWAAMPTVGFIAVVVVLSIFAREERMAGAGVAPIGSNVEAR